MVYIKDWTAFETAATDLYANSPRKVRYCVKFAPKTGHLVLKLTDDSTCIKYKTFSSIILNRFETLNLRLLSQISKSRARIRAPIRATSPGAETPAAVDEDDPMIGAAASLGHAQAVGSERSGTPSGGQGKKGSANAGGGGGGKKKKKGKR